MLKLILGITGIFLGWLLTYIAPEELLPGKKYFLLAKRMIFILGILILSTFFFLEKKYLLLLPSLLFGALLFILEFKVKEKFFLKEMANYLLLIIFYFLYNNLPYQLSLSSFLFLYGLPTGTLIWMHYHDQKKPSRS